MSAWQHCGRLDDHPEHRFTARQQVVVQTCECDRVTCICPSQPDPANRPRVSLRCPGKQVRSVEVEIPTEVMHL